MNLIAYITQQLFGLIYFAIAPGLPKSALIILGPMAMRLRRAICKPYFRSAGRGLQVDRGAYFGNGSHITIGNNVSFGMNFKLMPRRLQIGNNVQIDQETLILGNKIKTKERNHTTPVSHHQTRTPLTIGNQVTIGARVIITKDCTHIGDDVYIESGTVVNRNIPNFSYVAGNPARISPTHRSQQQRD